MIYLKARRCTKPVRSDKFITLSSERCSLPVIKIRKRHTNVGYQALVAYPEDNAPYDSDHGEGVWVHFFKNEQVGLKLPVLNFGQEINV